jgi:hypothetical protein
MIKNLSSINSNTAEGRLLLAALAKLTTTVHTDKTPDQVIEDCHELAASMFEIPLPEDEIYVKPDFAHALSSLINSYCKESGSNTPDFILAEYLEGCLNTFNAAVNQRTNWYQPVH